MALRSGYKGIKKLASGLKWNRPGILAADDTALAKVFFPRSEQAVLGAKNFTKIDASSDEVDGITYTIDENGVVDIDGTTGATPSVFYLNRNLKLPQGKQFIVSAGVENSNYYIRIGNSSDSFVVATRPNESHTFTADNTKNTMRIGVDANTTVSHVKIYPMIRLATDPDDTFAPPAMTNRELTENVNNLVHYRGYSSGYSDGVTKITIAKDFGAIGVGAVFLLFVRHYTSATTFIIREAYVNFYMDGTLKSGITMLHDDNSLPAINKVEQTSAGLEITFSAAIYATATALRLS